MSGAGRRAGGHLAHLLHRQRAAGREVLRWPARRLEQRLREALALLDERLADERDEQEEDGRRDAGHAHLDGGVRGERQDADGGTGDDEDAASVVVENGLVSELRARVEQVCVARVQRIAQMRTLCAKSRPRRAEAGCRGSTTC